MFRTYSYKDIEAIAFELRNNKIAVVKTDTIIGLISLNPSLIYKVKKRPWYKKLIKFVLDDTYVPNLFDIQQKFLKTFWPGQVTIIKNKISYRVPNDDFLLSLISMVGPLYCSSANISDKPVINDIYEANKYFDAKKLFFNMIIIDTNCKPTGLESTVIDIDNWKIKRNGCRLEEIKKFIKENNTEINKN